jgi:hypothetical protein
MPSRRAGASCPPATDASGAAQGGAPTTRRSAKYTACLRRHGVVFGKTNSRTAFSKATAACAKYMPKPGAPTTTTAAP